MNSVEVEVWVVVDEDGNTWCGNDACHAMEGYTDGVQTIGDVPYRMVKVLLTVPLPETVTVSATVPEQGEVVASVS